MFFLTDFSVSFTIFLSLITYSDIISKRLISKFISQEERIMITSVDNLLAQQYEINAGFPMPGATFVGGFDISF